VLGLQTRCIALFTLFNPSSTPYPRFVFTASRQQTANRLPSSCSNNSRIRRQACTARCAWRVPSEWPCPVRHVCCPVRPSIVIFQPHLDCTRLLPGRVSVQSHQRAGFASEGNPGWTFPKQTSQTRHAHSRRQTSVTDAPPSLLRLPLVCYPGGQSHPLVRVTHIYTFLVTIRPIDVFPSACSPHPYSSSHTFSRPLCVPAVAFFTHTPAVSPRIIRRPFDQHARPLCVLNRTGLRGRGAMMKVISLRPAFMTCVRMCTHRATGRPRRTRRLKSLASKPHQTYSFGDRRDHESL
jgi:hypothetical protein